MLLKQLALSAVLFLLLTDVPSDLVFVQTHGTDAVSGSPKMQYTPDRSEALRVARPEAEVLGT